MASRDIPHSATAERDVLGSCMLSAAAAEECREVLTPGDFCSPANGEIWLGIVRVWEEGVTPDPVLVSDWLERNAVNKVNKADLLAMVADAGGASGAVHKARVVADMAAFRRLMGVGADLSKAASGRPTSGPGRLVDWAKAQLEEVDVAGGILPESFMTAAEFMARPEEARKPWVIPGQLRIGWRVVLVGVEGGGKALCVDTPVPIPAGWSTMGDLRVGDSVWGWDRSPIPVVAATEVMLGRPCYRIGFSDGDEVVADASHEWVTIDHENQLRVRTTEELEGSVLVPGTGELNHMVRCVGSPSRFVRSVEPVPSVPVRCIQVGSPTGVFLVGRSMVPTHNSTLLRQMAVCVASGLHPMVPGRKIPPLSTLVLDMENPDEAIEEQIRLVSDRTASLGAVDLERVGLMREPQGLDLRSRRDRGRMEAVLERHRPALVLAGPAYKMYRQDGQGHADAVHEVMGVWDRWRTRFGFALIIEHHAPMGGSMGREIRPADTMRWLQWPDFGFGLVKSTERGSENVYEWRRWRGDRMKSSWPEQMFWGSTLPWEFSWPTGTLAPSAKAPTPEF